MGRHIERNLNRLAYLRHQVAGQIAYTRCIKKGTVPKSTFLI